MPTLPRAPMADEWPQKALVDGSRCERGCRPESCANRGVSNELVKPCLNRELDRTGSRGVEASLCVFKIANRKCSLTLLCCGLLILSCCAITCAARLQGLATSRKVKVTPVSVRSWIGSEKVCITRVLKRCTIMPVCQSAASLLWQCRACFCSRVHQHSKLINLE